MHCNRETEKYHQVSIGDNHVRSMLRATLVSYLLYLKMIIGSWAPSHQ
jgi:hypothetical protein